MSVEITDTVNYYKWMPSASGDLSLGYQHGGNNSFVPITTIDRTGNLISSALQRTTAVNDTDSPVFALLDKDGKFIRGFGTANSINANFMALQNQMNLVAQSNAGLTSMVNTVTSQASQAVSQVGSLINLNLDSRVATLSATSVQHNSDLDALKSQNLTTRLGVAENNLSIITSNVTTLNSQNLNTRLTSAEGQTALSRTDINTFKSQNLNTRIGVIENQNLDSRLSSITSTLGAISTADANIINQYNQLFAAVQALQLQVNNLTGGSGSGVTSNSNLFNMIIIQLIILVALVVYVILKK